MSKKQYTLQKLTIELVSVLLASLVAFRICEMLSIKLAYLPIVLVGCYIVLKLLYNLSIIMVGYVMRLIPIIYKREHTPVLTTNMGAVTEYGSSENNNEVLKKRMELFHYEYQNEQQEYAKHKEMEEDAKLTAMLKYTRDTFNRLDFEEAEVFQICECVRYFVTNRQALSNTEIRIRKRSDVTQISLKNFAWNIANQYNISGDATASFVFNTFNEWFTNTTIATIKKTLRTTNGKHKIEIDEKVLAKYLQNRFLESETDTKEPLVAIPQIYCCVQQPNMFNTIEQTIFIEQKRYFGRIKVKKTPLKRYILKKIQI